MKERILELINDFYGNDEYCEENSEELESLAEFISTHLQTLQRVLEDISSKILLQSYKDLIIKFVG